MLRHARFMIAKEKYSRQKLVEPQNVKSSFMEDFAISLQSKFLQAEILIEENSLLQAFI